MSYKKEAIAKYYGMVHQLGKLSEACLKLGYACLKNDPEYLKRKISNTQFLIDQVVLINKWGSDIYKHSYKKEDELYFKIYPERDTNPKG